MANRYQELTELVPKGTFYDADGEILPARSDAHEFLFETDAANRTYQVLVNEIDYGIVVSDAASLAIVQLVLDPGRYDIVLVDDITDRRFPATVTVRNTATVHAAHAEVFEEVDARIAAIRDTLSLETVGALYAGDVYGRPLNAGNVADYLLESYRQLLWRIRQAFRLWAIRRAGLRGVIGGYTGSLPLALPAAWRQQWVLGDDLAPELAWARTLPAGDARTLLPNLNARSFDFVRGAFADNVTSVSGPFTSPPSPRRLIVTFGAGWTGGDIQVTGLDDNGSAVTEIFVDPGAGYPVTVNGLEVFASVSTVTDLAAAGAPSGTATIGVRTGEFARIVEVSGTNILTVPPPGPDSMTLSYFTGPSRLSWNSGPSVEVPASGTYVLGDAFGLRGEFTGLVPDGGGYSFEASGADYWLWLEMDEKGRLWVDTTAGGVNPTPTAAQVVTEINAALNADGRYGALYSTAATTVGVGPLGPVVRLRSPTTAVTGVPSSVAVHAGGPNAARVVFGEPRLSADLAVGVSFGDTLLDCSGTGTADLPEVGETVEIIPTFDDDLADVPGVLADPDRPEALEVRFSALWSGGDLLVRGIDQANAEVTETFEYDATGVVLDSGTGDLDIDVTGTVVTLSSGTFDAAVVPGVGIRNLTDGEASVVRYRVSDTEVRVDPAFTTTSVTGRNWSSTKALRVVGATAFRFIESATNSAPAGSAVGTARVLLSDAEFRGYEVRVGQGQRLSTVATTGSITVVATSTAVFRDATNLVTELRDVGGFLVITNSATSDNDGVHEVLALEDGVQGVELRLRYGGTGAGFVLEASGSMIWDLYSRGETLRVIGNDRGAGELLLLDGALEAWASGGHVDLEGVMPRTHVAEAPGIGTVTVEVDTDFLPVGGTSDSVDVYGENLPDGFTLTNATLSATVQDWPALLGVVRFRVEGDGIGDAAVSRVVGRVLDYKGFSVTATFWVSQHVSASEDFYVSWDFGTGAIAGSTVSVGGLVADGGLDPAAVSATVVVPRDATTAVVSLVHVGTGAGEQFTISALNVVADGVTSYGVGVGTVAHGPGTTDFSDVVYVWSSERLLDTEETAIGLADNPYVGFPEVKGKVDEVMPAHERVERFDVSEYSGATPLNVIGAYDEVEWNNATLTNMELVLGTPPRLSYVVPSRLSLEAGEELAFIAPSDAVLAETHAHEGPFPEESFDEERLYENGVPVPATPLAGSVAFPWRFIAGNSIQVASLGAGDAASDVVFDGGSAYTIDYRVLMRAETAVLDLGAGHANYAWLVDFEAYRRVEPGVVTRTVEVAVEFLTDFRAVVDVPSNQDKTTATLTEDTGISRVTVARANWNFVDSRTIEIDSGTLNPDAVYTLEYIGLEPQFPVVPEYRLEWRSATTEVGVASASWTEVAVDDIVTPVLGVGPAIETHRYHQLRVTLWGIVDVRDVRVSGLGLRGIHLHGVEAFAPGILE